MTQAKQDRIFCFFFLSPYDALITLVPFHIITKISLSSYIKKRFHEKVEEKIRDLSINIIKLSQKNHLLLYNKIC
ncbi:hypothetical protein DX928_20295 [Bacillus swezeyi]|uniref:Uncharacterized protein n=1 Tax=Bacillus swezeyi TaxID=1925020 RepID=A0A5M8S1K0_9BACI|nr:hypothetical protein DX927_14885 [Bacillus swezeyi]KAA6473670.1 hypothetical protein DX928_20295 [Bacillus swezeyi]